MNENDEQFAGDELDDNQGDDTHADDVQEDSSDQRTENDLKPKSSNAPLEKTSRWKKKIALAACLGLCVTVFIAFMGWNRLAPEKEKPPAIVRVALEKKPLIELNSFVIPNHGKTDGYISFSISLKVTNDTLINEVKENREYLRGKIYDRLNTYLEQQVQMPLTESIKNIVENGINDSLSKGKIDGLYITQFLFI